MLLTWKVWCQLHPFFILTFDNSTWTTIWKILIRDPRLIFYFAEAAAKFGFHLYLEWVGIVVVFIINFKSFANYKENSCKYLECTLAFHYASTHWTPIKTLDLFLLCFKCQLAFCCCVEKYFRLFCPFSCPAKLSCACWLPPSIFQLITGKLCFASGLSIFCAAISSTTSLTKEYYIIIHKKTRQSLVYIFNLINSHKNFVLLACLFIYSYLFCGWAFNLITTEV